MTDAEQPKRGRGRPLGSRNKSKDGQSPEPKVAAPKIMVKDLPSDRYAKLQGALPEYRQLLQDEKDIKARIKEARKGYKIDFGADAVKELDETIKMQTPEGCAKKMEEAERIARLAEFYKLAIGAAPSLFSAPAPAPVRDAAFYMGLGREAFDRGFNGPCPDDVPAEFRESWETGRNNAYAASQHTVAAA